MKKLFLSVLALLSSAAFAADSFRDLVCKKTISDEIYLSTVADQISVKWVTRGGEDTTQILRALADKAIPSSLLSAYGDVRVEFSIPLKSCQFDEPAKFSCDFKADAAPVAIKVLAKVSPYEPKVQPDVYEGTLSAIALKSKFSGKKNARILEFPMEFEFASPTKTTVKANTDFFFAHFWDYDGFKQNPSCTVDKVFLED